TGFAIEGKPNLEQGLHLRYHAATSGFFRALGIPLIRGRFFDQHDESNSKRVVIINQSAARRYWPGEDPVGKRITFDDHPQEKDYLTVVGIVGDVKDRPNSASAEPSFWWVESQAPFGGLSMVVRAENGVTGLPDQVRNAVASLNPELAVSDVQLMERVADAS